jgi:hypothetical protein
MKFPVFNGNRSSILVFTPTHYFPLSWARSIQFTPSHSVSLGLPSGHFPSGFPPKKLYEFLFSLYEPKTFRREFRKSKCCSYLLDRTQNKTNLWSFCNLTTYQPNQEIQYILGSRKGHYNAHKTQVFFPTLKQFNSFHTLHSICNCFGTLLY